LAVEVKSQNFSTEDLMRRALELAEENVLSGKGGPYGAVVADSQGKIVGTGVNGIASRADPIAHAEVMAIRQACDRLGTDDLSACVLYVSSEPTSVGQALIKSVGIKQVYFGLSHADVHRVREASRRVQREKILPDTHYEQLCGAEALAMFYAASEQNDKAIAS
jgi:tRNA(Arg) A34 adenosine deaminase TadA